MLLPARVAAHCCLLLLLRSQGNKANNYRVAQLGICIAVLCTYVHVVRGYTFMPPPSQPTCCLQRCARHYATSQKKRVIVPSAYCVALRRKALNHAAKGAAAAVDEAPYLLNAAAQRRKARRGAEWHGLAEHAAAQRK